MAKRKKKKDKKKHARHKMGKCSKSAIISGTGKAEKNYQVVMAWFDGKEWKDRVVGLYTKNGAIRKFNKLKKSGNAVSYHKISGIGLHGGKRGKRKKIARRAFKIALKLFNKKKKKSRFKQLKGRGKMSRKRKHSRRRFHGFGGRRSGQHSDIIVMGKKRRSHRRRSRGLLMGDPGLVGDMTGNLVNVAAGLAGGVVGSYATNMIPVANTMIRAFIPLLGGVVLASVARMPVLKMAGLGLGIVGGLSLIKNVMPGVNLLGENPSMWIPAADRMGIEDQSNLGEVVEMAGEDAIGYASQADM